MTVVMATKAAGQFSDRPKITPPPSGGSLLLQGATPTLRQIYLLHFSNTFSIPSTLCKVFCFVFANNDLPRWKKTNYIWQCYYHRSLRSLCLWEKKWVDDLSVFFSPPQQAHGDFQNSWPGDTKKPRKGGEERVKVEAATRAEPSQEPGHNHHTSIDLYLPASPRSQQTSPKERGVKRAHIWG